MYYSVQYSAVPTLRYLMNAPNEYVQPVSTTSPFAMPYLVGSTLLEVRPSGNFILRATVMERQGGPRWGVLTPVPT